MPEKSRVQLGQSITEYIIIVSLVGLTVLFAVNRYGRAVYNKVECMTEAVGSVTVVAEGGTKGCGTGAPGGPAASPQVAVGNPPGAPGGGGGAPPQNAAPAEQPKPIIPKAPGGDPVQHHVGDGNYVPGVNGGFAGQEVENEGLSKEFPIELTQEQIDFAKQNGGKLKLTVTVQGVDPNVNGQFVDTVTFDGKTIGTLRNGANTFFIDVSNLAPGKHSLVLNSGMLRADPFGKPIDYDDFEYKDLELSFAT